MQLDPKALARKYLFDGEVIRLMGLVVLVKPLGLVTQMLMANFFGAGPRYDAYALAFFMVTFFGSVIGNVFTAVVVPFVIRQRDRLRGSRLLGLQNTVLLLFLLPAVGYTLCLMLGTGTIVDLVGPGLPAETKAHTVKMIRLMAIPGVLLLFGTMGKAVLNLNNRFRFAAAMPVLNAAVILLAVWLFHERFGILSFALGFGVSNALQVALLWSLVGWRRHAAPVVPSAPPGALRRLWSLCWMVVLIHAIAVIYQFIDKMFAASLVQGSISAIAYAHTILISVIELFLFSLVVVMFTRMSELATAEDMGGLSGYVQDNVERLARLVVPAALVLFACSGEVVRVIFMRGAFTAEDAELTRGALALYILGLPAYLLTQMAARLFNSLQRLREMIWLSLLYLVMNVGGNALLVGPLQVRGLALSSTLAVYLHLVLAFWVLHRYRIGLSVGDWVRPLLRYHAVAFAAWLVYAASGFGDWLAGQTTPGRVLDDLGVAAGRALFLMAVYGLLLLTWNRAAAGRGGAGRGPGGAPAPRSGPLATAQMIGALHTGGAEQLAVQVANARAAAGDRSHLYVLGGPGPLSDRISPAVTVRYLHHAVAPPSRPWHCLTSLRAGYRKLAGHLAADGVDVVQSHLPGANFWNLWLGVRGRCTAVPTVHSNREFAYGDDANPLRARGRRWLYRRMLDRCGAVVAVSEKVRDSLLAELGLQGRTWPRLVVVPNGVPIPEPLDDAARTRVRARFGCGPETFLVLAAGRHLELKDYPSLIRAVADLDPRHGEVVLVLAGEGPLTGDYRRLAAELGLAERVHLPGNLDDLGTVMQAADGFAISSRWEGLSMVMLEAMACGLPVVGTRISGIADLIEDGVSGLLVPPGDGAALTAALGRLIADADLRAACRAAGRETVRRDYSIERVARDLERVYREALSRGTG